MGRALLPQKPYVGVSMSSGSTFGLGMFSVREKLSGTRDYLRTPAIRRPRSQRALHAAARNPPETNKVVELTGALRALQNVGFV